MIQRTPFNMCDAQTSFSMVLYILLLLLSIHRKRPHQWPFNALWEKSSKILLHAWRMLCNPLDRDFSLRVTREIKIAAIAPIVECCLLF